jgi:hypothetical protein
VPNKEHNSVDVLRNVIHIFVSALHHKLLLLVPGRRAKSRGIPVFDSLNETYFDFSVNVFLPGRQGVGFLTLARELAYASFFTWEFVTVYYRSSC